jgi:hypothetical protein
VHNHTILAMIYGQLGWEEEARAAARRIFELDSDFEENAWYELQQLSGAGGGTHGRGAAQSRLEHSGAAASANDPGS